MILIESIKIIKTERDFHEVYQIANMNDMNYYDPEFEVVPEEMGITVEMVRGRRFVNCRREEVVIGMTKEVQDFIGLPMEAFENMGGCDLYQALEKYDKEKKEHMRDNKDNEKAFRQFSKDMNNNLDKVIDRCHNLIVERNRLHNMGFWYRLKFLFIGSKFLNDI